MGVSDGLSKYAKIKDPKRVASIVNYLNMRRDKWEDLYGRTFALSGGMALIDSHQRVVAWVSIGPGGMVQHRPDLTYEEGGQRSELQLARFPSSDDAKKDQLALCELLGAKSSQILCPSR